MQKVRVFNDNIHPLKEIFKGERVEIGPKDYWRDAKGNILELDIYEANDYRGQYAPVPFDGSGKMLNDPRYFKMIKMEPVDKAVGEDTKVQILKCMMKDCKFVATSTEQLEDHSAERHGGVDKLVLPEQDHAIKEKKKAS